MDSQFVSDRVNLLKKYFLNRNDVLAARHPRSGKPCPIVVPDIDKILEAHVAGTPLALQFQTQRGIQVIEVKEVQVGSYSPSLAGKTKWQCIDIDGGEEHSFAVSDPDAVARAIISECKARKIKVALERSGGGSGWHVWIFFEDFVEASIARQLGFSIVPTNVPLRKGGLATPSKNRGIEIFPKSNLIKANGKGAMVWLPFCGSTTDGNNEFYCLDTLEQLESPQIPLNPASILDDSKPSNLSNLVQRDSRAARDSMLEKLDLKLVFADIMTGKKNAKGWWECHDPESPTGDQSPSAGVNDNDPTYERGTFHSFITGKSESVFDYMVRRGAALDLGEAFSKISTWTNSDFSNLSDDKQLPSIFIDDRQQREIIKDSWNVIESANRKKQQVFANGNNLVQAELNDAGGGHLRELAKIDIHGLLIDAANIFRMDKNGPVPAILPDYIAADIVARPNSRLPQLNTISGSPFFGHSGKLVLEEGYHPAETLLLHYPKSFRPPDEIPAVSAAEARAMLDELTTEQFGDFPFSEECDLVHTLAALFQPFIRKLIKGPTPLYLISASIPGSGKSLLVKIICNIAMGDEAPARVLSGTEEERKKMFFAELLSGRPIIFLDNLDDDPSAGRGGVTEKLHSPSLASILTTTTYTDRILGKSKMIRVPNFSLWMMTGNNPQLSRELSRRSVLIRLEPDCEKPWEKRPSDFKHPDILHWTRQNRSRSITTILTAINSWLAAGQPKPPTGRSLGSYEGWCEVVHSILHFLGYESFLGNQNKLEQSTVDPLSEIWTEFVRRWVYKYGAQAVKTGALLELAYGDLLTPIIGFKDATSQRVILAKQLSKLAGRIFYGHKIVVVSDQGKHGRQYAVLAVGHCQPNLEPQEPVGFGDNPEADFEAKAEF